MSKQDEQYNKDYFQDRIIRFSFLSNQMELCKTDYDSLSQLIFETDPYIYPAMFENYENAKKLLPLLFQNNDTMFCLDNCYVAKLEEDLVGLLLWNRGRLKWTAELLRKLAYEKQIEIGQYLDMVEKEYVSGYSNPDAENVISILNLCVKKGYRSQGIGRKIMETFLDKKGGTPIELCVLKDNINAIKLYEAVGFVAFEEYNGFSVDHHVLPAIKMRRNRS